MNKNTLLIAGGLFALAMVTGANRQATPTPSGYHLKAGALFCSTEALYKEMTSRISQGVREYLPGCQSTAARIPVTMFDQGFSVHGVRGVNNNTIYWVGNESVR